MISVPPEIDPVLLGHRADACQRSHQDGPDEAVLCRLDGALQRDLVDRVDHRGRDRLQGRHRREQGAEAVVMADRDLWGLDAAHADARGRRNDLRDPFHDRLAALIAHLAIEDDHAADAPLAHPDARG